MAGAGAAAKSMQAHATPGYADVENYTTQYLLEVPLVQCNGMAWRASLRAWGEESPEPRQWAAGIGDIRCDGHACGVHDPHHS